MQVLRYVLADVFTDRPLAGNQLAVFLAAEQIGEDLVQPIAREMNLSESVFLYPPSAGGTARVRYFTTAEELDFAGHPTLGTAAVLAYLHEVADQETELLLETRRAVVPVRLRRDSDSRFTGWMTQPLPTSWLWDHTAELVKILNVGPSVLPAEVYDNGLQHLFVMLEDRGEVLAVQPDFAALGRLCGPVRINVFAGSGATYTSRMFSPFDRGMPEDPACGSAAGPLAAHLVRHGRIEAGDEITISQGDCVGRPSLLYAAAYGDPRAVEEIRVGGSTVIVGEGHLRLGDR